MRIRWSDELVIASIQKRAEEHKPLYFQAVVNDDEKLTGAARRIFGSWDNALKAAGFDPQKVKRPNTEKRPRGYWSKDRVLQHIKDLHDKGIDLSSHSVQKIDGGLVGTAQELFGGWDEALKMAGINPSEVRKTKEWTPDKVVIQILKLYIAGEELNEQAVNRTRGDLYGAASTHFGSWQKAVEAASLDYGKIRRTNQWNKDKAIQYGIRATNLGLNLISLIQLDYRFKAAINSYFSSFGEFYQAVGWSPDNNKDIGRNRIREIRESEGLSQEELGRRIGTSSRTVGLYENGSVTPSLATALKLAKALDTTVENLFELE